MAVWQLSFSLAPLEGMGFSVSEESLCVLAGTLPLAASWSQNIRQYGDLAETCVELLYNGATCEEISVRLHAGTLSREQANAILTFAATNGLEILYDDRRLAPMFANLRDLLYASDAYRYVKNPRGYLEKLSKGSPEYRICDRKLMIPEGVTVIGIQDGGKCVDEHEDAIDEICLPTSLEVIGECAFFDCARIKKINIPPKVWYIGSQAFWGMDSLEEMTVPSTVTFMGRHAFCNCKKLKLTVPGAKVALPAGWDEEFYANVGEIVFADENE